MISKPVKLSYFAAYAESAAAFPEPKELSQILKMTASAGFDMASDIKTGRLLAVLAASKPAGCFLEIGTGTGISASWLLSGMTADAQLHSVEIDENYSAIAKHNLGSDQRFKQITCDAIAFLRDLDEGTFDLIFADTWPGKFSHLDLALRALKPGGFYVIDDLLPQPNWPDGHNDKIPPLLEDLRTKPDFVLLPLDWSTGLVVAVKISRFDDCERTAANGRRP